MSHVKTAERADHKTNPHSTHVTVDAHTQGTIVTKKVRYKWSIIYIYFYLSHVVPLMEYYFVIFSIGHKNSVEIIKVSKIILVNIIKSICIENDV